MECLSIRKKFKNKHQAWEDPNDVDDLQKIEIDNEPQHIDSDKQSDDEDDNYDLYANDVRSKKKTLETKELQFKHLTNINNERSYTGAIKQVRFNPKSRIALVTLSHGQADLFQVDGERNRYIQNIKLPRTRSPYCAFKSDGESIVISSKDYKGSFFTYDMISTSTKKHSLKVGKEPVTMVEFTLYGDYMACIQENSREIIGLSSKTYENAFSIKINENVKATKFTSENDIYIAGYDGQVYIWDLRKTSLCKQKFRDEGTIHITSFGLSEASNLVAIGSDSGIISTYELQQCASQRYPTPMKNFTNLSKPIDLLEFNSSGELLIYGSTELAGGLRMIHSHSNTIYKNFPLFGKKYGYVLSAEFSPLGGYLALGSTTGRAYLCRIPYYSSY